MAWELMKAAVVLWLLRWLGRLVVGAVVYYWLFQFTRDFKGF